MNYIKRNLNAIILTAMTFVTIILLILIFNINSAPAQNRGSNQTEMSFGEYLSGRIALMDKDYSIAADNYLLALSQDPENLDLNQFTLSVLITDGRFDEAARISKYLNEIDEATNTSKLLLFFENVKSKKYDTAFGEIDGLADTGIINLFKPFFKAWIFAKQKKLAEVDEIVNGFDDNSTFNFFNYYHSGLIYEHLGNLSKAEEYYAKSLTAKGRLNLRAVDAYGHVLRLQNKNDEALAVYNQYIVDAPTNEHLKAALENLKAGKNPDNIIKDIEYGFAEIFYSMATILMQDNVTRIATNFLQYAIYYKADFPLAHFLQAQIFESDKYFTGATKELNKITSDSVLYFQSKIQRAWLFNDMDQSEEALKALKVLEKEYPDNREVMNSIAEFYRVHERYAEAITVYDEIVDNIEEVADRDWVLFYTRGIVLDQEKEWDKAEESFKKALELRPDQPMVLNYLAYSWVDRGINYIEAKKMLERAVELRPNDGYIVDSLGWALFKMGDDEEAALVLERAAQLQTTDWAINDHLGDAYWIVGRKNEARFQWRHALSLSPDEEKIETIKIKIKNGYIKEK